MDTFNHVSVNSSAIAQASKAGRRPAHRHVLSAELSRAAARRAVFIAFYSGLLFAFLIIKPGSHVFIKTFDNIAQALGPLLAAPWVFLGLWNKPESMLSDGENARRTMQRKPIIWIGIGVMCYAIGQSIWTFYECVLHKSPQPSLSDLFYLCATPSFLIGILKLPAKPLPAVSRTRIVLDGMVIMTTAITFSWYYLVGPLVLDTRVPVLARLLGSLYPMQSYLFVYALLRLSARFGETVLRPAVNILSAGMFILLLSQSIYGYLLLHNEYVTGSLLDAGWPLGMMLVCLAAFVAHRTELGPGNAEELPGAPGSTPSAVRSLLPYAVVPAVWVFALVIGRIEHDRSLVAGVYVGAGILVALTLLRQSVAFLENTHLYSRLHEAYGTLAESNNRVVEHAVTLESINAELKAVQTELVQSAKLASLGTLAAGVAHELNQPLAVIRGTVQQMRAALTDPGDIGEDLELLECQTTRMIKIIQHLRSFARASRNDKKSIDMREVVADCFILIGADLKSRGIQVNLDIPEASPHVLGDANELEQVMLNLVTNAQDALEGRADPRISIRIRKESELCRIVVSDNGPGVPEEIAPQIFDPFFTTKEPGKGTGLGLSISHSIIRKHHGTIGVENNGGAVFVIILPCAVEKALESLESLESLDETLAGHAAGDATQASSDEKMAEPGEFEEAA